jgi:hypothetical protein
MGWIFASGDRIGVHGVTDGLISIDEFKQRFDFDPVGKEFGDVVELLNVPGCDVAVSSQPTGYYVLDDSSPVKLKPGPPVTFSNEWKEHPSTDGAIREDHTGNKYHRLIGSVVDASDSAIVDVYCVIEAFDVRCPARQHALKKLLCSGIRGKNDCVQDLIEARDAVERAITLERQRSDVARKTVDRLAKFSTSLGLNRGTDEQS